MRIKDDGRALVIYIILEPYVTNIPISSSSCRERGKLMKS